MREFEAITGKVPDEHAMTLALKRMLPTNIRGMLQTVEVQGYKPSKEYAFKRAREFRNERASGDTPGGGKGGQPLDGLDHLKEEEEESMTDAEA